MKNLLFLSIILLVSTQIFGQKLSKFPFEVTKNGNGNQSILFIPGFASSGAVWDETVKIYRDKYTCYTLTMAGFAGVKPEPEPSFKKWKIEIANFIKEEKIESPILIGHSMGGGLAMAIAADYPELVQKIIIVDALPC